jgi:hypothetical protein
MSLKGGIRRPFRNTHHPNWINSHPLETGLTISHLRGASDPGKIVLGLLLVMTIAS